MDTKSAVYECIDKVTGLTESDISEMGSDVDFIKEGIVDSLAVVSILSFLEKKLGSHLEMSSFKVNDFRNVDSLVKAVDTALGK